MVTAYSTMDKSTLLTLPCTAQWKNYTMSSQRSQIRTITKGPPQVLWWTGHSKGGRQQKRDRTILGEGGHQIKHHHVARKFMKVEYISMYNATYLSCLMSVHHVKNIYYHIRHTTQFFSNNHCINHTITKGLENQWNTSEDPNLWKCICTRPNNRRDTK
jgi:hypothetical protein